MWLPLSKENVAVDGFYWYRDSPKAKPEIIRAERGGTSEMRDLVFTWSEVYSVGTMLRIAPEAQVSPRIPVPRG